MKLCIDRWYAFQASKWKELSGKPFGIILTYGDTDLYTSGAINAIHTFETMCRFLDGRIAGIVHGSLDKVGDAEKHPELLEQAFRLGQMLGQAEIQTTSGEISPTHLNRFIPPVWRMAAAGAGGILM